MIAIAKLVESEFSWRERFEMSVMIPDNTKRETGIQYREDAEQPLSGPVVLDNGSRCSSSPLTGSVGLRRVQVELGCLRGCAPGARTDLCCFRLDKLPYLFEKNTVRRRRSFEISFQQEQSQTPSQDQSPEAADDASWAVPSASSVKSLPRICRGPAMSSIRPMHRSRKGGTLSKFVVVSIDSL